MYVEILIDLEQCPAQVEIKDTISEVKYGCHYLLVEVFMKVMNGFSDYSRGRQEIFICLAVLLCEQFCRFANGGAKISINSVLLHEIIGVLYSSIQTPKSGADLVCQSVCHSEDKISRDRPLEV